jgi:hypothetical protein
MAPTYGAAVLWIAENDAPGDRHGPGELAGYISVALVADLFGKDQRQVAFDVHSVREGRPGCNLFRLVLKARKARGESEAEARDAIHRPL